MVVFVSAIEVGSVRALIPVCIDLASMGYSLLIEKKGFFAIEEIDELDCFYVKNSLDENNIKSFLLKMKVDIVLFSVNISNVRPLKIARIAKELKIETIHLLDYWGNYRNRLELDKEKTFQPTQYLVPDEFAKKKAIEDGVNAELISVVGQPAFANVRGSYQKAKKLINPFEEKTKNGYKIILFASEPVSFDQGESIEENRNYRGYTEQKVLQILIKGLESTQGRYMVAVLPHPREDIKRLKSIWQSCGGERYGKVVSNFRSSDLLPFVSGVVGMASTLLYEAWLNGKPILSLQPGLRYDTMRMLSDKDGVVFVDKYKGASNIVSHWLPTLCDKNTQQQHLELMLHKKSSRLIIEKLHDCLLKK
jgi:hypothetical protein